MPSQQRPLIGQSALGTLEDFFAQERVLRSIRQSFEDAGVERDETAGAGTGGERRQLFAQYVATLDLTQPADAGRLLPLFEEALSSLAMSSGFDADPQGPNSRAARRARMLERLERDGIRLVNERLCLPSSGVDSTPLTTHATVLDAHQIRLQIDRLRQHDADPALAIGTAKELVETTCKTIIKERTGAEPLGRPEIPELVKLACQALKLAPDDIPDEARAVEEIRKLLRTLGTIPQALATIRNSYGTGHGPEGRRKGLLPRHARLAANSAIALSLFLLDSHQER